MDMEMQVMPKDGSNGATQFTSEKVLTGNGEDVTISLLEASEGDVLPHTPTSVGERTSLDCAPPEQTSTLQEESLLCRIQRELNKVVFLNVRLWMIIVFIVIFVLIIAVILISLVVCAAIHEDEDEKYDPSLFKVPLCHSGRFRLPNQVFTEDLISMSSDKSQVLASNLQEKIAGLYTSSPALGRYFSEALINAFSNGTNDSVIADYRLTFLMPEEKEEEHQLQNFTLSREMVSNVFRQFVYDQEVDQAQTLYIAPDSLQTFSRHSCKSVGKQTGAEHLSV